MARTLEELSKQMRQQAANIPVRANELKKNVAKTINFDLLQTTPVDTGLAMSNWQVQLVDAATEPRGAFVPSPKGHAANGGDIEATRQANLAPAVQLANQTVGETQPKQVIHLTNVLPYIQALDAGHSSQARLFVDRAIILGRDLISRAKLIL